MEFAFPTATSKNQLEDKFQVTQAIASQGIPQKIPFVKIKLGIATSNYEPATSSSLSL